MRIGQKIKDEKISTLSHGGGVISLNPSTINVGGIQIDSDVLTRTISSDVTLVANTLYMVYIVMLAGAPVMRISANVNSVGPAGFASWKLVGAFYSNGSSLFSSFVNIDGVPRSGQQSNTPTMTGFGTVTNNLSVWERIGDKYRTSGSLTCGIPTVVAAKISLGIYSLDTNKIINNTIYRSVWGKLHRAIVSTSTAIPGTHSGPYAIIDDSSSDITSMYVSLTTDTTAKSFIVQNGSSTANTGDFLTYDFEVPILGWSNTPLKDL